MLYQPLLYRISWPSRCFNCIRRNYSQIYSNSNRFSSHGRSMVVPLRTAAMVRNDHGLLGQGRIPAVARDHDPGIDIGDARDPLPTNGAAVEPTAVEAVKGARETTDLAPIGSTTTRTVTSHRLVNQCHRHRPFNPKHSPDSRHWHRIMRSASTIPICLYFRRAC